MTARSRRGNNEGTIRQRPDGRWESRISLPDGSRKSYYGATRAEVRTKLQAARRRIDQGENLRAKNERTGRFLERWLEDSARGSVRDSTYRAYANWVRNHLALPRSEGGIGDIALASLTPEEVQRMLRARRDTGLSATSVNRIRAVLRMALNQAITWGLVSRNVASLAKPPKQERFEIEPLSAQEVRALLATSGEHRLGNLFTVAVLTAMRQGELLALRWDDVDLENRLLRVRSTLGVKDGKPAILPPKSDQSRRTLRLSADVVHALKAQRQRQRQDRLLAGDRWQDWGLVFSSTLGTPLNGSNVTHRFQEALQAAGVRRVRFHDLRHSAASFLIASGVPMRLVQDQLGHSGLALTIATYSHISDTMKQDAADAMDALDLTARGA